MLFVCLGVQWAVLISDCQLSMYAHLKTLREDCRSLNRAAHWTPNQRKSYERLQKTIYQSAQYDAPCRSDTMLNM